MKITIEELMSYASVNVDTAQRIEADLKYLVDEDSSLRDYYRRDAVKLIDFAQRELTKLRTILDGLA